MGTPTAQEIKKQAYSISKSRWRRKRAARLLQPDGYLQNYFFRVRTPHDLDTDRQASGREPERNDDGRESEQVPDGRRHHRLKQPDLLLVGLPAAFTMAKRGDAAGRHHHKR